MVVKLANVDCFYVLYVNLFSYRSAPHDDSGVRNLIKSNVSCIFF
jgi:hypothetical protein